MGFEGFNSKILMLQSQAKCILGFIFNGIPTFCFQVGIGQGLKMAPNPLSKIFNKCFQFQIKLQAN
jgi:hypothetical protein